MRKSLSDRITALGRDVVCEIRKEIAQGVPVASPHTAILAELERDLGDKSPRRSKACGNCRGCRFIEALGSSTVH